MNLIISGDQKHLARIEALARELGLHVRRELASFTSQPEKELRRPHKTSGKTSSQGGNQNPQTPPSKGPLYGIE